MKPRISAIAVLSSKKRALGKDNKLLWHLPGDLKRLREITFGHPLIMGRKTMNHLVETVGKPLPGRTNIVITHDKNVKQEGFVITHSLDEALEKASQSSGGNEEIFIFGGAQIYSLALPKTDRLYLTLVEDEPEADAFFPDYSEFTKVVEKSEVMEQEGLKYYYLTLDRV